MAVGQRAEAEALGKIGSRQEQRKPRFVLGLRARANRVSCASSVMLVYPAHLSVRLLQLSLTFSSAHGDR